MARIINVEKAKYTDSLIRVFEENRVGQYSKFLDKTPLFVTYLHINENESRNDVGMGAVSSDVGPNSPVRYDQINQFPVYNIPELKPNIDYDTEKGYDVELDLSDITILPNTVKPSIGDHIIIMLPNAVELCFRFNEFQYNTIQSNDFYLASADLRFTGKNLLKRFRGQIVCEWETIFENIGTEDKCFIRKIDIPKIQDTAKLIEELLTHYYHNFFDRETGTFVCKNNTETEEFGVDPWYYDKYTEKFIMDSQIYYRDNIEESIVLSCADIKQDMERLYMETLYYAVLKKDKSYLAPYCYIYQVGIQKLSSPFIINDINCRGANLLIIRDELQKGHSDAWDSHTAKEYFSHQLIDMIKHPKHQVSHTDEENGTESVALYKGVEKEIYKEFQNNPNAGTEDCPVYYSPKIEHATLTYLDQIVYHFMVNDLVDIKRELLTPYTLRIDNYTYRIMPIIIYILMDYYDSYFKSKQKEFL